MMPNKANPVDAILLGLMEGAKHVKTPIQSTLSEVKKGRFCGGQVSGDSSWTRGGS